jgi:amino acid transporter
MKQSGLTTFALVMLITGAVDSIRNLPAASLFGSSLIFFFIFSAIVFLIPSALVAAELASGCKDKSGIFEWVKNIFGEKWAFLAIWLQWITNLVWFPTILSFIAGLIANLIDPQLAQNKIFLVGIILFTFWVLTLMNLKGLRVSTAFASFCAITGMVIPMALIIGLAIVWLIKGNPSQIHFTSGNIFPSWSSVNTWVSLTAIMTAFEGMELAAVHIKDISNPQRTFPRALFISVWIILITMLFGSLSIAIVLPHEQISLVNGVMQAFSSFFHAYHIDWFIPVITLMILIGSLGGIISWVISPAKGLLQAAQLGYLPPFLQKENEHGVAVNLLLTQAVIVTGVCVAFLFMPSVSASYWLLTALSTQLYMFMYVLMFLAGICTRYRFPERQQTFTIPGGKFGIWSVTLLGLVGCIITLIVGFCPPASMNVGGIWRYEIIFAGGMFCMILPIIFFYAYKAKNSRALLAQNIVQTAVE